MYTYVLVQIVKYPLDALYNPNLHTLEAFADGAVCGKNS